MGSALVLLRSFPLSDHSLLLCEQKSSFPTLDAIASPRHSDVKGEYEITEFNWKCDRTAATPVSLLEIRGFSLAPGVFVPCSTALYSTM